MSLENYKNLIIGSGEGGKYLAWHLAKSGQRTVVVERRWVGGSCPNVNCLPSKNEIWSAKVADLVHHATRFGITPAAPHQTWRRFENGNATWSRV
jgi:pyruvate/2-oxoglutarate dehydrogenase complex dihydrolipoamide dehydrogenase (E3) component